MPLSNASNLTGAPPRGGLTPMTTASSVSDGGSNEGPDGEELPPCWAGWHQGAFSAPVTGHTRRSTSGSDAF